MRKKARQYAAEIRAAVFKKLGDTCRKCGFADKRALQVDHVNGDSSEAKRTHRATRYFRRVLADTTGRYQILCANCNWIKRHEAGEVKRLGTKAHP